MKVSDIRALTQAEMKKKLKDLEEEYFNLRFQHGMGQLENPKLLPKIRRNIARVKTIFREMEMQQ